MIREAHNDHRALHSTDHLYHIWFVGNTEGLAELDREVAVNYGSACPIDKSSQEVRW